MSHRSNKQNQKKIAPTLTKNNSKQFDDKEDMRDLEEKFSKLNPMAKEYAPRHTRRRRRPICSSSSSSVVIPNAIATSSRTKGNNNNNNSSNNNNNKKGNGNGNGNGDGNGNEKRVMDSRAGKAQKDDTIKRTVYVSELHHLVTESQVAGLFVYCGQVVDCRVCGDPKSSLRFAFIEFTELDGAKNALTLSGTMLGNNPIKVLPSKTAIAPVNPDLLPRSLDEMEVCARTVYCTNIDRKVTKKDLRSFFESFCGEVSRIRILEDTRHHRRNAFVEFAMAENASVALSCSGAILGSFPIRVSPSKTAIRPHST